MKEGHVFITGSGSFSNSTDRFKDENPLVIDYKEITRFYWNDFERGWAETSEPRHYQKGYEFDCKTSPLFASKMCEGVVAGLQLWKEDVEEHVAMDKLVC